MEYGTELRPYGMHACMHARMSAVNSQASSSQLPTASTTAMSQSSNRIQVKRQRHMACAGCLPIVQH